MHGQGSLVLKDGLQVYRSKWTEGQPETDTMSEELKLRETQWNQKKAAAADQER